MSWLKSPIPAAITSSWMNKGKPFIVDAYFVSNLNQADLESSVNVLSQSVGGDGYFQMVHFPESIDLYVSTLSQHFDGLFRVQADYEKGTVKGMYFRSTLAYASESNEQSARDIVEKIANFMRVRYGIGAAIELAVSYCLDLRTGGISETTRSILVQAFGNGRDENKFYLDSVKGWMLSEENLHLNEAASFFLTETIRQNDLRHQFLLLWMCLKCQLGSGSKRTKYCLNELKSEIISGEMKRVHGLRSDYVHEGKSVAITKAERYFLLNTIRYPVFHLAQLGSIW